MGGGYFSVFLIEKAAGKEVSPWNIVVTSIL